MLDAAAATVATVLLAVTAATLALLLGARRGPALLVAMLVTAAGTVVAQTVALSLLNAYTQTGLLVAGAVSAVVSAGAWVVSGAPWPVPGRRLRPGELRIAVRAHPEVALLAAVAGAALAVQAIVAVAFAPSNWDSMTYHLSRAAYWLQYESAAPFPGGSVRQLSSPPNGEMLQAWTLALSGTDRFAALVQWLCLPGLACCVYLAAGLLRFGRPAALFAAALFVVLPQPVMQATSTQNDLIAAFLVLAVAVFGVRGLRAARGGDLAIAAIAAGLAVGTKGTVLALAPSVAIILGVEAWRARPSRRILIGGVAATVAAVALLGSWGYVQNVARGESALGGLAGMTARTAPAAANAVRVLWTFADAPGTRIPVLGRAAPSVARAVAPGAEAADFTFAVDTRVSEDFSAYGLIGLLVLLPVLIVVAVRRRPVERAAWAIAALGGIAAFCLAFEYNPWVGRLLLPAVALAAPLLAVLAMWRPAALLAAVAAIAVLWPSLTANANKPLLAGASSVQHKDRIGQMTSAGIEVEPVVREVERRLRPDEPLAFVGGEDAWDYPFFGEHRRRRVIRFAAPRSPSAAELRAAGVRFALFAHTAPPPRALRPRMVHPRYWFVEVP